MSRSALAWTPSSYSQMLSQSSLERQGNGTFRRRSSVGLKPPWSSPSDPVLPPLVQYQGEVSLHKCGVPQLHSGQSSLLQPSDGGGPLPVVWMCAYPDPRTRASSWCIAFSWFWIWVLWLRWSNQKVENVRIWGHQISKKWEEFGYQNLKFLVQCKEIEGNSHRNGFLMDPDQSDKMRARISKFLGIFPVVIYLQFLRGNLHIPQPP